MQLQSEAYQAWELAWSRLVVERGEILMQAAVPTSRRMMTKPPYAKKPQMNAGPENVCQELDSLQECMQQNAQSICETQAVQQLTLPGPHGKSACWRSHPNGLICQSEQALQYATELPSVITKLIHHCKRPL